MTHRERVRRGPRGGSRSRDGHDSASLRVCEQQQQQRPPCTDFDMAYFHSYAHVGIHEEMIKVKHVDCYTVTISELESVTTRYNFKSMIRALLHGFAFWFDVEFTGPAIFPTNNQTSLLTDIHPADGNQMKRRTNPNEALVLYTAPEDPPTHWQQSGRPFLCEGVRDAVMVLAVFQVVA